MTISVDKSGLLRFLAFWVATRTSRSGLKLYIALYLFFFILGLIVGNDPVILSGVPFLAYFTNEVDIRPPTAWIFAQFVIANIASAVLVSSNPTNLVLSGAFGISFFSYTAKLIVPVLAAAIFVLPVLLLQFRGNRFIPRRIKPLTLDPRSVLVDPFGGVFGATFLILTLCTLVGTSVLHPQVYLVTVPPAVIVGMRDIIKDIRNYKKTTHSRERDQQSSDAHPLGKNEEKPPNELSEVKANNPPREEGQLPTEVTANPQVSSPTLRPPSINRSVDAEDTRTQDSPPSPPTLYRIFPTTLSILKTMPFSLVLFSFCMFILVQGLVVTGWVDVWAAWWGTWVARTGTVGAVFGMGLVSCILCNVSTSSPLNTRTKQDHEDLWYKHRSYDPPFSNPTNMDLLLTFSASS
jgi:Na+/H+ antiporter NhaD/arsenite permease-like protein